ncbi:hypothetical protein DFH27DRAFT_522831 [Peziza echinospora]|nr:hypothetical protein DFH27DRAFT_522831 [Peziza echinospora]
MDGDGGDDDGDEGQWWSRRMKDGTGVQSGLARALYWNSQPGYGVPSFRFSLFALGWRQWGVVCRSLELRGAEQRPVSGPLHRRRLQRLGGTVARVPAQGGPPHQGRRSGCSAPPGPLEVPAAGLRDGSCVRAACLLRAACWRGRAWPMRGPRGGRRWGGRRWGPGERAVCCSCCCRYFTYDGAGERCRLHWAAADHLSGAMHQQLIRGGMRAARQAGSAHRSSSGGPKRRRAPSERANERTIEQASRPSEPEGAHERAGQRLNERTSRLRPIPRPRDPARPGPGPGARSPRAKQSNEAKQNSQAEVEPGQPIVNVTAAGTAPRLLPLAARTAAIISLSWGRSALPVSVLVLGIGLGWWCLREAWAWQQHNLVVKHRSGCHAGRYLSIAPRGHERTPIFTRQLETLYVRQAGIFGGGGCRQLIAWGK